MKVCALVAVLILGHVLPGLDGADTVTCHGQVFIDCFEYCNTGCGDVARELCLGRCEYGCGCMNGFLIVNNGGCRKLDICKKNEQDVGETESTTTAEQGTTESVTSVIEEDQSSNGTTTEAAAMDTGTNETNPVEQGPDDAGSAQPLKPSGMRTPRWVTVRKY